MANYYWVGGNVGTTASYSDGLAGSGSQGTSNYTWLRAFDWNNPLNWRSKVGFGQNIFFATPVDAPGINDIAIFGYEGTEGVSGFQLPTAVAPCLWGGAAGNIHGATWYGAGSLGVDQYGTTFASSLYDCQLMPSGGRTGTQYPFKYFGGGLDSYDVVQVLENAEARGFTLNSATWQGASWTALVNAAKGMSGGYDRWSNLRLKTRNFTVPNGSTGERPNFFGEHPVPYAYPHWGIVDVDFIHNRVGSTAAYGMETSCELYGPCEFRFSGYMSNIVRYVPRTHHIHLANGYSWNALGYRTLTLSGATAINVVALSDDTGINIDEDPNPYGPSPTWGSWGQTLGSRPIPTVGIVETDETSNIHKMSIDPGSNHYTILIGNRFVSASVFAETTNIGGTVGSTGENLVNFEIFTPPIPSGEHQANVVAAYARNGVIIGAVGSTGSPSVNANYMKIGSGTPSNSVENLSYIWRRIPVLFTESANINRMDCKVATFAASRFLPSTNFTVKIGELNASNFSEIRFTDHGQIGNKQFDNWEFGTQNGAVIDGGIVFLDDTCLLTGSNGVRLFNDQLDLKTPRLGDNSIRATSPKESKTPTVTPTPA